ncbi:hypothetical protein HY251_08390 [bacterium]|nr:hypothetical protein [bacterium]
MSARRAIAATLAAVFLGDALRRVVLAILEETWQELAGPGDVLRRLGLAVAWSPWRDLKGPAFVLLSGLLAGSALALSGRRSVWVALALATLAALVDRGAVLTFEALQVGPALYDFVPLAHLERLVLEAAGLWALLGLAGREDELTPRAYAGYALFALSRLGPDSPDKFFVVDLLGALETFQLLRKWKPGQREVVREAPGK